MFLGAKSLSTLALCVDNGQGSNRAQGVIAVHSWYVITYQFAAEIDTSGRIRRLDSVLRQQCWMVKGWTLDHTCAFATRCGSSTILAFR